MRPASLPRSCPKLTRWCLFLSIISLGSDFVFCSPISQGRPSPDLTDNSSQRESRHLDEHLAFGNTVTSQINPPSSTQTSGAVVVIAHEETLGLMPENQDEPTPHVANAPPDRNSIADEQRPVPFISLPLSRHGASLGGGLKVSNLTEQSHLHDVQGAMTHSFHDIHGTQPVHAQTDAPRPAEEQDTQAPSEQSASGSLDMPLEAPPRTSSNGPIKRVKDAESANRGLHNNEDHLQRVNNTVAKPVPIKRPAKEQCSVSRRTVTYRLPKGCVEFNTQKPSYTMEVQVCSGSCYSQVELVAQPMRYSVAQQRDAVTGETTSVLVATNTYTLKDFYKQKCKCCREKEREPKPKRIYYICSKRYKVKVLEVHEAASCGCKKCK